MNARGRMVVGVLALVIVGCGAVSCMSRPWKKSPAKKRAPEWAQPVELAGAPNLHRLSDDLYRGAQPTEEGMRALEELGVKTIVNLRLTRSDRGKIDQTPLDYEHIYMQPWEGKRKNLLAFLRVVTDETRTPVFVHCKHGSDRTGTACAAYRVVVQGWSKEQAIDEMLHGDYGFHTIWDDLVGLIESLDVEGLRKELEAAPTG